MTVRDIQAHLEEIYGAEISPQTISNMTDRILAQLSIHFGERVSKYL